MLSNCSRPPQVTTSSPGCGAMSTARAPAGTRVWVLMTAMLSSCGALFQIWEGRLASLRETDFMGIRPCAASPSVVRETSPADP
ncbi:hypothetical protein D3C77_755900 [compost metagenome]